MLLQLSPCFPSREKSANPLTLARTNKYRALRRGGRKIRPPSILPCSTSQQWKCPEPSLRDFQRAKRIKFKLDPAQFPRITLTPQTAPRRPRAPLYPFKYTLLLRSARRGRGGRAEAASLPRPSGRENSPVINGPARIRLGTRASRRRVCRRCIVDSESLHFDKNKRVRRTCPPRRCFLFPARPSSSTSTSPLSPYRALRDDSCT